MQRVVYTTPTLTSPTWAGDYLERDTLVPGGAKVDSGEFSTVNGKVYIPSGTLVGRNYTERLAGTGFHPAIVTAGVGITLDDEVYLLAFDVVDALTEDDCELYRHNALVKENFLPGYGTLHADALAKIRSLYSCTLGAD
jgi:hypothetical protein